MITDSRLSEALKQADLDLLRCRLFTALVARCEEIKRNGTKEQADLADKAAQCFEICADAWDAEEPMPAGTWKDGCACFKQALGY